MHPNLIHVRPSYKMGFLALDTLGLTSLRLAAIFLLMAESLLHAQNVAVMGATELTGDSASLRAYLDNPNKVSLLGCGVVFSPTSVNPNPMIGGTGITQITRDYLAEGPFQLEATGLAKNTKYSYKAYVTHASATNYSTAATFTTLANHIPALTVHGAGNTPAFLNTASLGVARSYYAAALLADGKVLVAGGSTRTGSSNSAELYSPGTAGWTTTGSLVVARDSPKATLLPNGHILLTGGIGPADAAVRAEIYDPATGIWTETARMSSPRYGQTSTLLRDNTVLLVPGGKWQTRMLRPS